MLKRLVQIAIILSSTIVLAQRNEATNWYFGENAGLNFNIFNDNVNTLLNGKVDSAEGCTSISDSTGRLLFYTDGHTVWNRNHTRMNGGWDLNGSPNNSQSSIIVPKPNDLNIYYIFTTSYSNGLSYSIVDMSLDGGRGAVILSNINLIPYATEKISAVAKDCANKSIWVMTFAADRTFHAFEINNLGLNTTSVKTTISILALEFPLNGYMKFSPDGTKLVTANMGYGIFLYDFDVETGLLSNERRIRKGYSAYGVEFSPDSQLLYVHFSNDYESQNEDSNNNPENHFSILSQFDLNTPSISQSEIIIDNRNLFRGSLQLATNGKIYRSLSETGTQGTNFFGVINNPNEVGLNCDYQHDAVNLSPNKSRIGTPSFIQTFFRTHIDIIRDGLSTLNLSLCTGETYTLTADDVPNATYTWTLNGELLPETDFDLVVSEPGHYEVLMSENNGYCPVKGQAYVKYFQTPIANQADDLIKCSNENGIATFDFLVQNNSIMGNQDFTSFSIHYFKSLIDAENRTNEILGCYTNSDLEEEIFVRIENNEFTDCYDIASFFVRVFNAQLDNTIKTLYACDDDIDGDKMNGQVEIDLQSFNSTLLGNQNEEEFFMYYFLNEIDAISNTNALPDIYYNQIPYFEEIYVRVENKLNTTCYDIGSFTFNITMPESYNTSLIQCDDKIIDGLSSFNLSQANDELTGGIGNRYTKFFLSLEDAKNSQDEVDINDFNNTVNPQIVYAQVIDYISGCFNISELTLIVTNNNNDTSIEASICDDTITEDGFNIFNLNELDDDVLGGLSLVESRVGYFESYNDALLEQNEILRRNTYRNTIPYHQTIYARIENSNACYGIKEIDLIVKKLPNLNADSTVNYCLNQYPEPIILEAGVDDENIFSFNWSTGETTNTIEINMPGTYKVSVGNEDGCFKERVITVEPSNIATIESVEVIDFSENNIITVLTSGEGIYEYALYDDKGIYYNYQDRNTFENIGPGIYTINVRDVKNDCGITQEPVSIIGFPKYFTPNNDGINDTWQVYGVSDIFQPNSLIFIYDRYGKLVKQLSPASKGWDGNFNGEPLPNNDYWFAVTLQDGRIFKNHFSLKR